MLPAWVHPFLVALRKQGVVARACETAKVAYSTVYALRREDADFAAAWDEALEESYDALEAELLERATNGVPEPLTYQGTITYEHERNADGSVVQEAYDTGVVKDGKPVMGMRPKLLMRNGRPVPVVIHKKSDALLMFALKGRRKRVYADRSEITGADGETLQPLVIVTGVPRPDDHSDIA